MRDGFLRRLLLPVAASAAALCVGACGSGGAVAGPDPSGQDASTDARVDGAGDSGACPPGSYPIECNGVVLYCCPPGAHCDPPSCGSADGGDGGG